MLGLIPVMNPVIILVSDIPLLSGPSKLKVVYSSCHTPSVEP